MTWITFKYGAKKAWLWFKKYGYLVAIALVAIFIFAFKGSAGKDIIKGLLDANDKGHTDREAALKEAHERELQRVAEFQELQKKLVEDYNFGSREAKKRAEEALKENTDLPIDELAKKMAREWGGKVVPPE